ncbi:hypothetical protein LSAT2_018924 [Lamellibrachia satsuma]|nr:hypothetical protein LSAT2_018924 [Lamellibrachia satsuma]
MELTKASYGQVTFICSSHFDEHWIWTRTRQSPARILRRDDHVTGLVMCPINDVTAHRHRPPLKCDPTCHGPRSTARIDNDDVTHRASVGQLLTTSFAGPRSTAPGSY